MKVVAFMNFCKSPYFFYLLLIYVLEIVALLAEKKLCATDCELIIFVALLAEKERRNIFYNPFCSLFMVITTNLQLPFVVKSNGKKKLWPIFHDRDRLLSVYIHTFFPFLNSLAYACISFLFLLI